jgi:hypothetical protein
MKRALTEATHFDASNDFELSPWNEDDRTTFNTFRLPNISQQSIQILSDQTHLLSPSSALKRLLGKSHYRQKTLGCNQKVTTAREMLVV